MTTFYRRRDCRMRFFDDTQPTDDTLREMVQADYEEAISLPAAFFATVVVVLAALAAIFWPY